MTISVVVITRYSNSFNNDMLVYDVFLYDAVRRMKNMESNQALGCMERKVFRISEVSLKIDKCCDEMAVILLHLCTV